MLERHYKSKAKKHQYVSDDDRTRIVDSYINGNHATDIANVLGFKRTTVYAILRKYINGEDYARKLKGGERKKKLSDSQRSMVQSWIDDDCSISLTSIKSRVLEEFEVDIAITTIARNIKDFSYSFIRVRPTVEETNGLSTLETRASYANMLMNELSNYDESKVFFLDEGIFNVTMCVRSGYGKSNNKKPKAITQSEKPTTGMRKKQVSVCCAMRKYEVFEFYTDLKLYYNEPFYKLVESFVKKLAQVNVSEAVIIMNDIHTQNSTKISELIAESGHKLVYLPPNSNFLNPVEHMYTRWKELIRGKNPENEKELFEIIDAIGPELTLTDCHSFYEDMLSFIPKCLNKEEIQY